jgi:hypothetical protein
MSRGLVDDDSKLLQEDTTDTVSFTDLHILSNPTCLPLPLHVLKSMSQILAQFQQRQMCECSFFFTALQPNSAVLWHVGLNQWASFKIHEDLEPLAMKATCYFEKSGATYPATKTGMLSNRHN